jgi:hypothetical protein
MIDTVLERRHFRIETGKTAGTEAAEVPVLPTIDAGARGKMGPISA